MSAWTSGNYTKKGLALLTKLTQGASLKITRAVTGTGYVQPSVLANQTGVTGIKQTLKFMAASYPETGVCKLPMFITNEGLTAKYTAKQIGIYALDPDVGEILYFIAQSEDGTIVPSESVMPEYSSTWTFYFRYGQADNVSVTVDPSHTITEDMLNEVRIIAETGVSDAKHGGALVVDNTANLPFVNLKLFGKSTQIGTPTPAAPADIVSAGDGGNLNIGVYGKNLCPENAFDTMSSNGSNNTYDASTHKITFNAASTAQYGRYYPPIENLIIGKAYTISFDIKGTSGKIVYCGWSRNNTKITLKSSYVRYSCTIIAATKGEQVIFYTEKTANGGLASGEYMQFANVQIAMTEADTEYEAYKTPQTMSVGGVLAGIPVSSGGNYTDTDGQQWVCDEIDFERGVYIQRVMRRRMLSSDAWSSDEANGRYWVNDSGFNNVDTSVICTHFANISKWADHMATRETVIVYRDASWSYGRLSFNTNKVSSLVDWKNFLDANAVYVIYELATPIETALSFAETEAFNALVSNNPCTTIVNDGGANMEADCFLAQHETAFERIYSNANTKAKKATEITDASVAMVKDVHEDAAPYAKVLEIGGMTRKCRNLIPYPYYESSKESGDAKLTVGVDGGISGTGTPTSLLGVGLLSTEGSIDLCSQWKDSITFSVQGTFSNLVLQVVITAETTEVLKEINISSGSVTYKRSDYPNAYKINCIVKRHQDNVAMSGTIYAMCNVGTEALPYETYFDGLRSAPVTEVESVGVNLIPYPYTSNAGSYLGVNYDVNTDGGITLSGTPTGDSLFVLYEGATLPYQKQIFSITGTFTNAVIMIHMYDASGKNIYAMSSSKEPLEIDMVNYPTAVRQRIIINRAGYGAACSGTVYVMGNEGTTALPYTPYRRNTIPIPAEVQALDGYGCGVNADCYNYIDWERKQFVKRVTMKIFDGTETLTKTGNKFAYNIPDAMNTHGSVHDALCSHFDYDPLAWSSDDKTGFAKHTLYIYMQYVELGAETVADFKAWLSAQYANGTPVTVYYELAEPVITDISDLLPSDNLIGVEGGGTVTMVNAHRDDVPNTVVFSIGNNKSVGAGKFVGFLDGIAARAKAGADGKPLATQEWVLEQLASLAAATLALNQ